MVNNLESQASKMKEVGISLMTKSGLFELLGRFGRVHATGSFAYNLMLDPDIDIYLELQDPSRESAKAILNALIDQGFWNGYKFFDWKKFRRPQFPKGYYLGLKTDWKDKRWKIDIWLFKRIPKKFFALEKQLLEIDKKTRLEILKRKDQRNKKRVKKSSFEIYKEILGRAT